MNQLDDTTRRALSAADQPPPGVEDRILAAILTPVGPGPGGEAGAVVGSGAGGIAFAAKVVAITLGLAAAGVGAIGATSAGIRAWREPPVASGEPIVEGDSARVHAPAVVAAAPTIEPAPIDAPNPLAVEPSVEPIAAPAKPAPVEIAEPTETTVEAELALMQQARAAAPKPALALLEQHRKQFGSGVFAAEREVLRFEQLCALGRAPEAEVVAAKFVAKYPHDPLRSRVTASCD